MSGLVLEEANTAVSTSASFSGYTVARNLIRANNVGIQFFTSGVFPSSVSGNCFPPFFVFIPDVSPFPDYNTIDISPPLAPALRTTSTSVSCTPSSVALGDDSTCTATVTDTDVPTASAPTGTVAFTSATGSFDSPSCALVALGPNSAGCQVQFTPGSPGNNSATGDYVGDAGHHASSGSDAVNSTATPLRTTSTSVDCSPASATINTGSSTCTVTVADTDTGSGTASTPTGSVSFASASGSFVSTTCTLSAGSCAVHYTPDSAGPHTVFGDYGGDSTHDASSDQDTVTGTVPPPDTTAPTATIVRPGAGARYSTTQTVTASYTCADDTPGPLA